MQNNDFMNYVGYQLYGGGDDPNFDAFRKENNSEENPFLDSTQDESDSHQETEIEYNKIFNNSGTATLSEFCKAMDYLKAFETGMGYRSIGRFIPKFTVDNPPSMMDYINYCDALGIVIRNCLKYINITDEEYNFTIKEWFSIYIIIKYFETYNGTPLIIPKSNIGDLLVKEGEIQFPIEEWDNLEMIMDNYDKELFKKVNADDYMVTNHLSSTGSLLENLGLSSYAVSETFLTKFYSSCYCGLNLYVFSLPDYLNNLGRILLIPNYKVEGNCLYYNDFAFADSKRIEYKDIKRSYFENNPDKEKLKRLGEIENNIKIQVQNAEKAKKRKSALQDQLYNLNKKIDESNVQIQKLKGIILFGRKKAREQIEEIEAKVNNYLKRKTELEKEINSIVATNYNPKLEIRSFLKEADYFMIWHKVDESLPEYKKNHHPITV